MSQRGCTTYGMVDGFDYDRFAFTDAFPKPTAYVVAYGMAHFHGPDGRLWFCPDDGRGGIDWAHPQNVAEFDARNPEVGADDPTYRTVIERLCFDVDSVRAMSHLYSQRAASRGHGQQPPATVTVFRISTDKGPSSTYDTIEAAYEAADRLAVETGATVYVDEFTGETDNPAYRDGWRPRKHVIAEDVNGDRRALGPERYVRVSLYIENRYELYPGVVTRVDDVVIPEPPTDESGDEYSDWSYDHIQSFTGTGQTKGDAWYDVTITASDRPELLGRTFYFGY